MAQGQAEAGAVADEVLPHVDVRRRFDLEESEGRTAAELLESVAEARLGDRRPEHQRVLGDTAWFPPRDIRTAPHRPHPGNDEPREEALV